MSSSGQQSNKKFRDTDWYSIQVDSVRMWMGIVLCLLTFVGAYTGYQRWSAYWVEQRAYEWVDRATSLKGQLAGESELDAYRSELRFADERLQSARNSLAELQYKSAATFGRDAYDTLQGVLEGLRLSGSIAWFRSVEGDVRFRRGDSGEFMRAYPRVELQDGDYVMSASNATAEIHFRHEEAVFTLRPGSLIKLSRELSGRDRMLGFMEYGWVALDTAEIQSGVRTPYTEVMVDQNSRASLQLQEGSRRSRIRVDEGTARAASVETGEVRELETRQEVRQTDAAFGRTRSLPPTPRPAAPPDGFSVNIDTTDRVTLSWTPVRGAARYALQVSKSRHFAYNWIDVDDRRSTSVTLGHQEEGKYLWRVAAVDVNGDVGSWSAAQRLSVDSYRSLALEEDEEPPFIDVDIFMNGHLALLRGRTEPGARLEVNGRWIPVSADGSFSSTQAVFGTGQVPVVFKAVDLAGNDTIERRTVFVDAH